MRKYKCFAVLMLVLLLSGCNAGGNTETTSEQSTVSETVQSEEISTTTSVTFSEQTTVSETVQFEITTQTTKASVSKFDKLIKFEDGDDYGYKDIDGNIVVPAQYPNSSYFNNPDMTGEAVKVENALYYIYKDGTVFLKMDDIPVVYSDFYNGFAFYDGRFIDEQGNTVYESLTTRSMDRIAYWGNGYFEDYYFPSYNGIGYHGHSSFIDAYGNEKISTCNVRLSEIIDGYVIVNGYGWVVLVNDDFEVKVIFLNAIKCMPNYVLTDLRYDYDYDKHESFLKIRKGYKPLTEPYDFDEIDEIKRIFKDDCDMDNVLVYIYDGDKTEINLDDWDRDNYEYEIVDMSDIINGNIY